MDRDKLPQWARDRLDIQEKMGELETSTPPLVGLLFILYYPFVIALWIGGCAAIYLIGKAIVE